MNYFELLSTVWKFSLGRQLTDSSFRRGACGFETFLRPGAVWRAKIGSTSPPHQFSLILPPSIGRKPVNYDSYCLPAGLDYTGRQSHRDRPRPPLFSRLSQASGIAHSCWGAVAKQDFYKHDADLPLFRGLPTEPTHDYPLASAPYHVFFCTFPSILAPPHHASQ